MNTTPSRSSSPQPLAMNPFSNPDGTFKKDSAFEFWQFVVETAKNIVERTRSLESVPPEKLQDVLVVNVCGAAIACSVPKDKEVPFTQDELCERIMSLEPLINQMTDANHRLFHED